MAAREVWEPLFATIEERWSQRFGKKLLGELRTRLTDNVTRIEIRLPEALPILKHGLGNQIASSERSAAPAAEVERLPLSALLSKPLLAFALAYERDLVLSLAIGANVLRLFDEDALRARDLPRLAGVSKEAIAMALGFLSKRGFATVEKDASGARVVRLTAKGREARRAYECRLAAVEERWRERFGNDAVDRLCSLLAEITTENGEPSPRLLEGLTPHPENWRAALASPTTLPHFPMVLHRGGYPDGS